MENFVYQAGTEVWFGKDQIQNLKDIISRYGKRVLLCYGGGSIKRMGLYDTIMRLLDEYEVHELSGIAPNPKVESVKEGIALCHKHNIDVVLAVGGGSVIDCAKVIAAGTYYLIAHQTDGAMNNGIASSKAAEIARLDAGWD